MTDVFRCPEPDALLVLLYDDEGDPDERTALQAHVDACTACSDLLTSLATTRGALGAWRAPHLPLGFAIVRQPERPAYRRVLWSGGLAAAAVLVLAAAAGLAQVRITYDQSGLTITTGGAVVPATIAAGVAPVTAVPAQVSAPAPDAWIERATANNAPWRAELDQLASELREEFVQGVQSLRASQGTTPAAGVRAVATTAQSSGRMSDEEILRRVQELLDQSEVRQQQNLALRVTELGRQFQLQRQADIVQVEQALTRVEQQRNELLRRVSATQPR